MGVLMGTQEFISKAKVKYGDRFNYDKVEYINSRDKVCIKCNQCSEEFWIAPSKHLSGRTCPYCKRAKKTTKTFIADAQSLYGTENFDYSKVEYTNAHTKVCIKCNTCGREFWQEPSGHLSGRGCCYCGGTYKHTKEEFITKAKQAHSNKNHNYDKVDYINNRTKVCIVCNETDANGHLHGEFWIRPHDYLHGQGCPKCKSKKISSLKRDTQENFLTKAYIKYGDTYDYSKVKYTLSSKKIIVICHEKDEDGNEHGEFLITPNSHLQCDGGCPKCKSNKIRDKLLISQEEFEVRAKAKHGNKYDYSQSKYMGQYIPVAIICPVHGVFYQTPITHWLGCGCKKCTQTKLEEEMELFLSQNGIGYVYQQRFKWLGASSLDFYLPTENIAIECQGKQHYEPVDFAGKGEEWAKNNFEYTLKNDNRKRELCKENKIQLIYYTHDKNATENGITFKSQERLLEYLKNKNCAS